MSCVIIKRKIMYKGKKAKFHCEWCGKDVTGVILKKIINYEN